MTQMHELCLMDYNLAILDTAFLKELRRFRVLMSVTCPEEAIDLAEAELQDAMTDLVHNASAELHKTVSGGAFVQCSPILKAAGILLAQMEADVHKDQKLAPLAQDAKQIVNWVAGLDTSPEKGRVGAAIGKCQTIQDRFQSIVAIKNQGFITSLTFSIIDDSHTVCN